MDVIYEDNHIIVVNKTSSEIVQGDKTGDIPLSESLKLLVEREIWQTWKCIYRCSTPP